MGHRPIARRRVVLEWQSSPLVREVVEASVVHRLPDLPLDQGFPYALARWFSRIRPLWITFEPHRSRVAQGRDRQADATGR